MTTLHTALRDLRGFCYAGCNDALVAVSLVGAFLLRFDFAIPGSDLQILQQALVIAILVKIPVFHLAGFHRSLDRFAGLPDLLDLLVRNVIASTLFGITVFLLIGRSFPRSIYLIDLLLCFLATSLLRFSTRVYREAIIRKGRNGPKRILIYGAGEAGVTLLREIRSSRVYEVVGFLDDDPDKQDRSIMGVPVLGRGEQAASVVPRLDRTGAGIEEIVIAIPSATGRQRREAMAHCRAARIPCKTIPGLFELLDGRVLSSQIRNLSLTDLLNRQPVHLDETPIRSRISGHSILITGAAGSIGSELCRQVARYRPKQLIAFDQAESELFRIEGELRERFPGLEIAAELGDIRELARVDEIFERYDVESVFHAAAYKHVPVMESHVLEAARNNVLGTWNLITAARRRHVPNFLMISSDKAVNPTSVMGATKRVCELIVSARPPARSANGTKCVSVRFGNVLGSNGSVVPIFQTQIAAGGPVKVTHPDIQRYFMTTEEAVSLVLQASTMGSGSEIYVLDMGEPVRVLDLAIHMIELAGFKPYEEIDIELTGLRPGEKLFEEINLASESMLPTHHDKIRIFRQYQPSWETISTWISGLKKLLADKQERAVIAHIQALVPEYHPSEKWAAARTPSKPASRAEIEVGKQVQLT